MASEDTRERDQVGASTPAALDEQRKRVVSWYAEAHDHLDKHGVPRRPSAERDCVDYTLPERVDLLAAVVSPSPVDTERPERWMVDYEHGEGEPQHTVLSWLDDEAKGLPDVGEYLIRESDAGRLAAAPPVGIDEDAALAAVNAGYEVWLDRQELPDNFDAYEPVALAIIASVRASSAAPGVTEGQLRALRFYADRRNYNDGVPGESVEAELSPFTAEGDTEWHEDGGEKSRAALAVSPAPRDSTAFTTAFEFAEDETGDGEPIILGRERGDEGAWTAGASIPDTMRRLADDLERDALLAPYMPDTTVAEAVSPAPAKREYDLQGQPLCFVCGRRQSEHSGGVECVSPAPTTKPSEAEETQVADLLQQCLGTRGTETVFREDFERAAHDVLDLLRSPAPTEGPDDA